MIIYVGTTTKEINSTYRPTLTTQIDVQLKDGVSITAPVIKMRDEVYDPSWNYIYIPKWSRYYFLHEATIINGIWYINCAIDVLASYKTQIQSSTAYVRRSASDYSVHLEDSTWSHSDEPTITKTTIDCGLSTSGCFLLYVVCDSKVTASSAYQGMPTLTVYKCDVGSLIALMRFMFSEDFYDLVTGGLDNTTKQMTQTFFNPFQYVVKCMWVPFGYNDLASTLHPVRFGWWRAGSGREEDFQYPVLDVHKVTKTFTFTQGTHTDWTDRNASWTNTTLYVPAFGQLTLSPDFQGKTITGEIICDLATGDAGLFLKDSNGALLQSASGKLGADVQLSSLYADYVGDFGSKSGAIQSTVKMGIGAVTGMIQSGKLGEGLKNLGNKIGSTLAIGLTGYTEEKGVDFQKIDLSQNSRELASAAVNGAGSALQPTLSTIGANGTRAIIEGENNAILTITKYARYADIHTQLGGVCNKVRSLSGLSGYTEVVNPHVALPATSDEIQMVNNFLSGGFYLE